ncbi:hypothetical protein KAT92_06745 [Candidatus Babeliales bacterium]|nr:hypothetical protein [Candidatus Babeliales bacterium]
MKNLKEIAILVKEEFNNPKLLKNEKYAGLCIVIMTLVHNKITTVDEVNQLSDVIDFELNKRTKIYLFGSGDKFRKQEHTNNNSDRAYIWKPFVTTARNKFLDKIITQ